MAGRRNLAVQAMVSIMVMCLVFIVEKLFLDHWPWWYWLAIFVGVGLVVVLLSLPPDWQKESKLGLEVLAFLVFKAFEPFFFGGKFSVLLWIYLVLAFVVFAVVTDMIGIAPWQNPEFWQRGMERPAPTGC